MAEKATKRGKIVDQLLQVSGPEKVGLENRCR